MIPADLLKLVVDKPLNTGVPWSPYLPAVYFLVLDDEVVYVGFSTMPAIRVRAHRGTHRRKFDRALYLHLESRDGHRMERDWIRRLTPRYNRMCNPKADLGSPKRGRRVAAR